MARAVRKRQTVNLKAYLSSSEEENRITSQGEVLERGESYGGSVSTQWRGTALEHRPPPEHWRGEASLAWLSFGRIVGIQTKVLIGVGACQ